MAVAANDDGLTDYERQRLAHVARNREYMARLGVMDLASKVAPPKTSSTSSKLAPGRKRVKREPTEPSRRSGRLLNVKPEHDGSAVDLLGDEEDGTGERGRKRGSAVDRIATGPAGDASYWDSEDAALEASRQWLEDARALMLARTSAVTDMPKGSRSEEATRARWRKEAVGRWGDGVRVYFYSRMGKYTDVVFFNRYRRLKQSTIGSDGFDPGWVHRRRRPTCSCCRSTTRTTRGSCSSHACSCPG